MIRGADRKAGVVCRVSAVWDRVDESGFIVTRTYQVSTPTARVRRRSAMPDWCGSF